MPTRFDEQWLAQAIELEEAANCDISAGLDFGSHLSDYLRSTDETINETNLRPAFTSILEESLGTKLSAPEIEDVVNRMQILVRETIQAKQDLGVTNVKRA